MTPSAGKRSGKVSQPDGAGGLADLRNKLGSSQNMKFENGFLFDVVFFVGLAVKVQGGLGPC